MGTDLILIKKVSEVNSYFAELVISLKYVKTYVKKQTLVARYIKQNNCIQRTSVWYVAFRHAETLNKTEK